MTRYAAFLRGINLGGRRLTNDELRDAFAGPGVAGVATYRASGNVVFEVAAGVDPDDPGGPDDNGTRTTTALETRLESRLAERLGFETTTFIRPLTRLAEIASRPELEGVGDEGFKPHLIFLKEPMLGDRGTEVRRRLAALASDDDRFTVLGAEVIWLRRGGIHDAPIQPPDLVRAFGGEGYTQRTLGTVRGIVKKFG